MLLSQQSCAATTALWHAIPLHEKRTEAARGASDARARRQGERYMQMGASALMIGPRRPEASGASRRGQDARDRGREPERPGSAKCNRSYTKARPTSAVPSTKPYGPPGGAPEHPRATSPRAIAPSREGLRKAEP